MRVLVLGCPRTGGSLEQLIHDSIGPFMALCLIAAAGILGIHFRRLPPWRHLVMYSLLTSALALLFLVALVSSLETRTLTGLWQRLLLTALLLWCAVIALRAYRYPGSQYSPSNNGLKPTKRGG